MFKKFFKRIICRFFYDRAELRKRSARLRKSRCMTYEEFCTFRKNHQERRDLYFTSLTNTIYRMDDGFKLIGWYSNRTQILYYNFDLFDL